MSTTRTVGKGVAWNFSSNLIEKGIVFANVLIILSYLSVYEYGLIELVLTALSTVGIILLPGLTGSITADMGVERARGEKGKMKALFSQYMLFLLVVSLIAFFVLFFGATAIAGISGNASIGHFLQIISFSFLIAPLRAISLLMATVHIRFIDQSLYPMVEEVAKTLGLLSFFYLFHLGPQGLLFAVISSQLAAVLVFLPRTWSGYRHFASAHAEGGYRFWEIFGTHRKWSVLASYLGTLMQNMQLWIIKLLLGTEAVGLYAFATGIMGNVSSLLPFTDVFTSLGPKYLEKKEEFVQLIKTSIRLQTMMAFILIVAACIGLPVLLMILPKYVPAAPLTVLMLFVLIPTSITIITTPTFNILKEQFSYFLSVIIKFILTGILMTVSVLAFGIIGIGIGSILINILSGFERYWRLKQLLPTFKLTLRDFFILSSGERALAGKLLERVISRLPFASAIRKEEPVIASPFE
ncbi:MAG: hypothetical protein JWL82_462 [Parcubacteria group bacterium]|nr:hypothetical protein [Parcubacteria group bacterium]